MFAIRDYSFWPLLFRIHIKVEWLVCKENQHGLDGRSWEGYNLLQRLHLLPQMSIVLQFQRRWLQTTLSSFSLDTTSVQQITLISHFQLVHLRHLFQVPGAGAFSVFPFDPGLAIEKNVQNKVK